jgi:hypothetical protein
MLRARRVHALVPGSRLVSAAAAELSIVARADIGKLWTNHGSVVAAVAGTEAAAPASPAARELIDKYKIHPATSRDEDITPALGEAFDRLLLLLVPFESPDASEYLERLFTVAAKHGMELSLRTIQHLFARCQSYPEALSVFHCLRKSNVKLNMHAYYAMCFCLQRLEEESWALRFQEKVKKSGKLSPQAAQFILDGCAEQLLPESKPWLGRVVFADVDPEGTGAAGRDADYDALGQQWAERYGS